MADNTPNALDGQPTPAAPAPMPAAAMADPTPAAPAKAGGVWAGLTGKQRLAVVAGGSVIAVVGAMYGAKQFTPGPARAVAQTPAVAPAEPEKKPEAEKKPEPEKEGIDLPPVISAPVKPAEHKERAPAPDPDKFKLPDLALPEAPRELPTDVKNEKKPGADVPELRLPPVPGIVDDPAAKAKAKPDPDVPELKLPPTPGEVKTKPALPPTPGAEKERPEDKFKSAPPKPALTIPEAGEKPAKPGVKPGDETDQFKTPGKPGEDLPTISVNSKVKPPAPAPEPVKRTGGWQDTPPAPPAGLKIEESPATPGKKPGAADIPLDLPVPPPLPTGDKPAVAPLLPPIDDKPVVGPTTVGGPPMPAAVPMLPEVRPGVKLPDPPTLPPIEVRPATPKAEVAPATKKDDYEEDWHTPDGPMNPAAYVSVSTFYYKTPDYAKALEAYNRDRRKPGERIVRVPPTWVLDEKFASLLGKDAKAAGLTFDKVEPAGGTRPAPPPSPAAAPTIGNSDEYRVTAGEGEKIKEIARKVYGDPNAWRKLTDLNPNLDPTEPIPAGTTLRVGK